MQMILLTLTYIDKPSPFFQKWKYQRDSLNKTGGNVFCLPLINEESYLRDLLNSGLAKVWFSFQLTWLACLEVLRLIACKPQLALVWKAAFQCVGHLYHLTSFWSSPVYLSFLFYVLVLIGAWSSCGTAGPTGNSWGWLRLFCPLRFNYHHWQTR